MRPEETVTTDAGGGVPATGKADGNVGLVSLFGMGGRLAL
jgi:hypothetical protein